MLKMSDNISKCTLLVLYLSAGWFATTVAAQSDPSVSCQIPRVFYERKEPPSPAFVQEEGNVDISADKMEFLESGDAKFSGNVELFQKGDQFRSDNIDFYSKDSTGAERDMAEVYGNVNYWDEQQYVVADRANVEFVGADADGDVDNVTFSKAEYITKGRYFMIAIDTNSSGGQFGMGANQSEEGFYQGKAVSLYVIPNELTELTDGDYTTCTQADSLWRISASRIKLDRIKHKGSVWNMVFKIKDIPVFYFPYVTFSLDLRRKTGFLSPTYGQSSRGGFLFTLPLYLNLAPNMDATITSRYLDKDGIMLIGDYRYLLPNGSGNVHTEYLSGSKKTIAQNEYLLSFYHQQSFLGSGRVTANYNYTSYERYLEDLGTNIGFTSRQFLTRSLLVNYIGSGWSVDAQLNSYQTIDPSISVLNRPYKRLPQIRFNAKSPTNHNSLNYELSSELVYFDRSADVVDANNVTGLRLDLFPSLSFPLGNSAAYINPRFGVRYTQYYLDETSSFSESPYRLLPSLNIDAGIFLERDFSLFGSNFKQTLDPRVFYVYVPEKDQSDLPIFDTSVSGFSSSAFFRSERFNGPDRMGDANQITFGLSSRILYEDTGKTLLEANLAQIHYFKDRVVTLANGAGADDTKSSLLIAGLSGHLGNWSLRNSLQWDPELGFVSLFSSGIQYKNERRAFNVDYRSHRYANTGNSNVGDSDTVVRQITTSFSLPIGERWKTVGKLFYEVKENRIPSAFFGIEYGGCCWAGRFVVKRFLTNSLGEYDFGFFYQIQLKGLLDFGGEPLGYFQQVAGYTREF